MGAGSAGVLLGRRRIRTERSEGNRLRTLGDRLRPRPTFTGPQVARVALLESEARAPGVCYEVATLPFGDLAWAYEVNPPNGLVKILLDPASAEGLPTAVMRLERYRLS